MKGGEKERRKELKRLGEVGWNGMKKERGGVRKERRWSGRGITGESRRKEWGRTLSFGERHTVDRGWVVQKRGGGGEVNETRRIVLGGVGCEEVRKIKESKRRKTCV